MGLIYVIGLVGAYAFFFEKLSNSYQKGAGGIDLAGVLVCLLLSTPYALFWPISIPYVLLFGDKG